VSAFRRTSGDCAAAGCGEAGACGAVNTAVIDATNRAAARETMIEFLFIDLRIR
jgi:hypothetical protein